MQFRFFVLVFSLFLLMMNSSAQAAEILVKSAVTKVTVFPSGAQIVRIAKIELPAGDQTIVLQDLPERLIPGSLRVEGAGEKGFEIGSVDSKRIYVNVKDKEGVLDKSERKQLEDIIEKLGDDMTLLTSRISAAQTQRRLMERLTDLPGQSPGSLFDKQGAGGGAGLFSVENWGKIFDLIGTRLAVADDLILKYRRQKREKAKDIAKLKKRLTEQPPKKERQMEVRVAVHANAQMSGVLKIKYQVREASWRPFYDARLTTGEKGAKPSLALSRRAGIRQWSGEDWSNVKLSLSTTSPQKGAQAAVLHPKRLDLVTNYPASKPTTTSYLSDKERGGVSNEMRSEDTMEAAPAPVVEQKKKRVFARQRRASIRQYAFQAVFDIPGLISILPTGDEKKVAISSDYIDPMLKIKAVPKINTTAFLYAKFTHDKKATPLLPGSVALYRDGTFTGNSHMQLVNAGDEYELGFGGDDAVKVVRSEVKRTKGQAGVFTSSKTDERRYIIKISNLHQTAIDVEVIDQIPFSVNEKVVVRLLPSSTTPSRQNIKEKRGILAWDFRLPPSDKKSINLDYTITWPADRTLSR
ncbi:MAG: mucoidy inhibitor MuiA family protein [bacterium]|nr:mucoidy inhibitor MuiA family protein [bacterium]